MAKTCKTCGGNCSEYAFGKYKCSWCGHKYEEQDFLSEEKKSVTDLETFSLLNKARVAIELEYDFKKSLKYSQSVLEKNPSNQDANWLALIAENQIIYIQNDKAKYVPTFLDPERACLVKSKYYSALGDNLKADADAIEKVRLDTVAEFKKVKPYDVFISYKQHETDNPNSETKEAVWARDIYTELKTNPKTRSLNVFFDQKCLSGANAGWEPHIFSAIKSSKCMIILGSTLENINSRWVKNEWKRFMALKACGEKKDFIVLGSDAVNPMLLDEKLQEKQMISNTSGKWIDEIINRVAGICGKPVKEKEELPPPPPKKKKKVNKKAIAAVVACLCLIVAGVGIWFGVSSKQSADRVSEAVTLIDYLPDYQIQDYTQYEVAIDEAYTKYNSLSDSEKNKVSNKDRLLNLVDGFNNYRVQTVRTAMENISADTVAETDDLKTAATVYNKLTSEQKAMLTAAERAKLDSLVKVYGCVTSIEDIKDDVMAKYGDVDTVNKTYLSLSPEYRQLVYNYALVETFNSQYAFYSNLIFTEVTGGYSITLKEGGTLSGKLEIPEQYKGQSIVEIPENAFASCSELTSVTVPDTVKTIGKGAFNGCNKIEQLTLPFVGGSEAAEAEEAVLGYVFGYEVATRDRDNGTGFINIETSPVDGTVLQYSNVVSYYRTNMYCYYIPTSLKTVMITKQEQIPVAAFNGCTMLTSVNFTKTLITIGNYALQNCTSLEKFNSEDAGKLDLTGFNGTIGNYAFSDCSLINEINVPQASQIGEYSFENLRLLTNINISKNTKLIGVGAFKGCNKVESLTLPYVGNSDTAENEAAVLGYIFGYENTKRDGDSIGFVNVTTNTVDGTVLQYTYCANYYTTTMYHYYIPTTLRTVTITEQEKIPLAAFNSCEMLTSISFTKTLITIGNYALQNCTALEKFNSETVGKLDLTGFKGTVGDYAFSGCSSFNEIVISQVSQIGEYSFQDLRLLTEVEVSANTKSVGLAAFKGCTKLESLTLPYVGNSDTAENEAAVLGYIFGYENTKRDGDSIGFVNVTTNTVDGTVLQYTYCINYYTTTMYHYYIPTSLRTVAITHQTEIPLAAFNGCDMLTSVTFNETVLTVGDYSFQNCESLSTFNSETAGTVNLSGITGTVGKYAFANCRLISDIKITSVSLIGEYAFKNLNLLSDVIVGNSTKSIGVGAFNGCSRLVNLTLPFVGNSEVKATSVQNGYEKVLGYIFGYENTKRANDSIGFVNVTTNTVDGTVLQYTYCANYYTTTMYHYYIPTTLRTVTITKQTEVPLAAFNYCQMLTKIVYKNEIESTGDYAFQKCVQPTVEVEESD